MARPRIQSEQLLVNLQDAAVMLRVNRSEILKLIAEGHLRPHPVLAGRIARSEVERFALDYVSRDAQADSQERRPMDAPATEERWGIPPLRLR